MSVAAVSPNSVRVSFSPIELIDRNGPISHFTVYYSGTRLQPEQKTIIVVATGWEQLIEGLEEDSEYSVSVSASTLVGEGPTSTVIKVTTFTSGRYLIPIVIGLLRGNYACLQLPWKCGILNTNPYKALVYSRIRIVLILYSLHSPICCCYKP